MEAAANAVGFDFHGVDKPKNSNSPYGLRYAEFVVPIVKAVQEQQDMIEGQNILIQNQQQIIAAQEQNLAAQQSLLEELLQRIEALERE